jgi:hypothetical protein
LNTYQTIRRAPSGDGQFDNAQGKAVAIGHHLATRDQAAVDHHIEQFVDLPVERHDGILGQFQHAGQRQLGAAQFHGKRNIDIADQVEPGESVSHW